MLFSKIKFLNRIKELYMCKVEDQSNTPIQVLDALGMNKGSVAMRFKIDATTFAFLNCHLKAGEGKVSDRVEMLSNILEETFLRNKGFPRDEEQPVVVIFGDLNFRVSLENQKAREAVMRNDIEYLKQFDELICLRNSKEVN